MNFYEQSPEMKRTLLESAVGRVTIAANGLESKLKLIVAIHQTNDDESFEKEFEKFVPLGMIIKRAKVLNIFDEESLRLIEYAKERRNDFTHELSDKYVNSINDGSMYELLREFMTIREEILIAADRVQQKLDEMAGAGGVTVENIKEQARKAILKWENQ